MALINCPECGKENVSDAALACPSCGFPIKDNFDKLKISQAQEAEIKRKIEEQKKKEAEQKETERRNIEAKRLRESRAAERAVRQAQLEAELIPLKKKDRLYRLLLAFYISIFILLSGLIFYSFYLFAASNALGIWTIILSAFGYMITALLFKKVKSKMNDLSVDIAKLEKELERNNGIEKHMQGYGSDVHIINGNQNAKPFKPSAALVCIVIFLISLMIIFSIVVTNEIRSDSSGNSNVSARSSSSGGYSYSGGGNSYSSGIVKNTDERFYYATGLAIKHVKTKLNYPADSDFQKESEMTVTRSGDYYTVKGYVDAANGFGAKQHKSFTVKMKIVESGGQVHSEDVTVTYD